MAPASSTPLRETFLASQQPSLSTAMTTSPPLTTDAAALLSYLLGHPTEPATGSLYSELLPYYSAPDAQLDPAPHINRSLTALVNSLQGLSTHCTSSPAPDPLLDRASEAHHSFAALQLQLCGAIDASPALQDRASVLRAVAQRAESRLELYYVPVLLSSGYRADARLPGLQHDESAALVGGPGVSAAAQARASRVAAAAADFPYINNYVTMVRREAGVLRAFCKRPVRHVVFCGSGPLPLTGLLLGAHLGARVTMVDNDAQAVARSRDLLSEWGRRGVIDPELTSVVHAGCEKLRFCADGVDDGAEEGAPVLECDVLFAAALIPQKAKECVARHVAAAGARGPLVVTRSAHGLTKRLGYDESGRERIARLLDFIGTVVPRTHELADGRIVDDCVKPIDLFESEILNSLELYQWRAGGDES